MLCWMICLWVVVASRLQWSAPDETWPQPSSGIALMGNALTNALTLWTSEDDKGEGDKGEDDIHSYIYHGPNVDPSYIYHGPNVDPGLTVDMYGICHSRDRNDFAEPRSPWYCADEHRR